MESVNKIRVLIADDSFFIRHYLMDLLQYEEDIEIVGTAATGDEAVDLAIKLKPDVITMDYHMPGKNGVEAAAAIMLGERPLPAIIMLSAFEGKDGSDVRSSLEATGAQVITKPSGEISLDIEKVVQEIVGKIIEVGSNQVRIRNSYRRTHHDVLLHFRNPHIGEQSAVVVIGASTGGPPLVEYLLSLFDASANISVVIVQHMSQYFTELFAHRLDRVTDFEVREARDGDTLSPGVALVVPGGMALASLENEHTDKNTPPQFTLQQFESRAHEILIDQTMKAIAENFGSHVYGILLSGMGTDGTGGLRAIKECGGCAIAQDPHTASVSSMPRNALLEGVVDVVLPIEDIAQYVIAKIVQRGN